MKRQIIFTSLIAISLIVMSFSQSSNIAIDALSTETTGPSGRAYAVTWQNDAGYWFAVGPTQALWAGESNEEKAIEMVRGYQSKKNGHVKYKDHCGKFRVYDLGVNYNSYDTDAIKYARKKGYDCNWP